MTSTPSAIWLADKSDSSSFLVAKYVALKLPGGREDILKGQFKQLPNLKSGDFPPPHTRSPKVFTPPLMSEKTKTTPHPSLQVVFLLRAQIFENRVQ